MSDPQQDEANAPSTLDKTAQKKNNSRGFNGDWQYVDEFNAHVDDFFNLSYIKDAQTLLASKVAYDREYYEPKKKRKTESPSPLTDDIPEPQFESTTGSYWSAEEKNTFFDCLARYSIHRIEEFSIHLPNKSVGEILVYFHLLKKEAEYLKTYRKELITFNKKDEPLCQHLYWYRDAPEGIKYSEIPYAQEVDDEYMEYEEDQSIQIANREMRLETDRLRKQLKFFNAYTGTDENGDSESLINLESAAKASKIYRGNQITPVLDKKAAPRLIYDSVVYLDEIVKAVTRRIMGAIILRREDKNLSKEDLSEENKTVTSSETFTVANTLYKSGALGPFTGKRKKTAPLQYYWDFVKDSLNLVTDDTFAFWKKPEKVEETGHSVNGVTDNNVLHFENPREIADFEIPSSLIDVGARGDYVDEEISEEESETENTGVPMVTDLLPKPDLKRTYEDLFIEEMLCALEDGELNEKESFNSQAVFGEKDHKVVSGEDSGVDSAVEDGEVSTDHEEASSNNNDDDVDDNNEQASIEIPQLNVEHDLEQLTGMNVREMCPMELREAWDRTFAMY